VEDVTDADPVPATPDDTVPWYLRPNYDPSEIIIDPDGSVRGGTVPALVERLTAHEHGGTSCERIIRDSSDQPLVGERLTDPQFIKTFLMTFKSFTTLDELFNLLVARFNTEPPLNLSTPEHQNWVKLKRRIIQARYVFRSNDFGRVCDQLAAVFLTRSRPWSMTRKFLKKRTHTSWIG
jgi:hypothetical protein